jgi:hypothetical protein
VADATLAAIEARYRRDGLAAAMRLLTDTTGIVLTDREPGATLPRPTAQRLKNLNYLLGYDTVGARQFRLDVEAVRVRGERLDIGAGTTSLGGFPCQCAYALALLIERSVMSFPGGHTGYITHPRAFAERLRKTLAG